MKRVFIIVFFLMASLASVCEATAPVMSDYCSAPPYVTRTVKPNILVMMDNSQVMRGQAYTAAYSSTTTYDGYFRSDLKYYYDGGKWVPSNDSASHPSLFSGNLLNWATTSQYDLLQKILAGGKSASRQTNINTLVSESGSWSKTYSGCVFNVDGGNLQITETTNNACVLLNSPVGLLASSKVGTRVYFALSDMSPILGKFWNAVANAALKTRVFLADLADSIGSAAYAAKPLRISTTNLPDIIYNQTYSATITAEGGSGEGYTWSISSGSLPSGISIDSSGTPSIAISSSGSNVTASTGDYTFTVKVTDSANNTDSRSYTVTLRTAGGVRVSSNYNVKVCVGDYTTNCDNAASGTILKSGIIDKFWDEARFGLEDFSQQASTISAEIANCIPADPKSSFLTGIENATPVGSSSLLTPLVDGAYTAIDYYKNNTAANCNPFASAKSCTKNFLLLISAGEGANLGSSVFTDATNCGSYTYNLSKNTCYGFKNDLRSDTGTQNVYSYVVNTMGSYSTILHNAADAGGGKFYNVSQASNLQGQLERAFSDILAQAASGTAVSVLTTSSRAVGSMVQAYFLPTVMEGTREVWWTGYLQSLWIDPQDNLREDTWNDYKLILDTSRTEGDGDKILKLFFDNTANEAKVAVFDSGSDGILTSTKCTSGVIKPFNQVKYLWEAGKKLAKDKKATYGITSDHRKIITSNWVYRFANNTTIPPIHITTNLFTAENVTGDPSGYMATALNGSTVSSDPFYIGKIARYVRGECLETVGGGDVCTDTLDSNYRDRRLTVDGTKYVWKLGDIVSSTPKVLANTALNTYHFDYGDSSYSAYVNSDDYKHRSSFAFVGGNDGMLHAFRVGYLEDKTGLAAGVKAFFKNLFNDSATTELGDEKWAFIPYNAFPYLKYLADPGYCHIYYNDLSVRLVDVNIGGTATDDATSSITWRTILIGGMRLGGAPTGNTPLSGVGFSVYYAIDVTDPENPTPLWEFSDKDMGYSTGYPSIIRTGGKGKNGNWYLVFGSGSTTLPKTGHDIYRSTTGYLYILDLKTGNLVKKLDLGHNAIVGDPLAIDADKDYQPEKLYFGTAFTTSTAQPYAWQGKLMSLALPADVTQLCGGSGISMSNAQCTAAGSLVTLFSDNYPFTASPDATKDTQGNIWVYIGSGKYFSDADETDSATQIFLGIKDQGVPRTKADLTDRSGFQVKGEVTSVTNVCAYNQTTRSFSNQSVVTAIKADPNSIPPVPTFGWYVLLGSNERVISRPLAAGGVVDFLTYIPSNDPCAYGGSSKLYALDYITGVAPSTVAIRAPGATSATEGTGVTVYSGIDLGEGPPPTGEAIIIPPPKEGQELLKKKIQVGTGVIVEAVNSPTISVISKFLHWLRK